MCEEDLRHASEEKLSRNGVRWLIGSYEALRKTVWDIYSEGKWFPVLETNIEGTKISFRARNTLREGSMSVRSSSDNGSKMGLTPEPEKEKEKDGKGKRTRGTKRSKRQPSYYLLGGGGTGVWLSKRKRVWRGKMNVLW